MATDGWMNVSVGDLVDVTHGYVFQSEYFCDSPTQDVLVTPGSVAIGGGFKSDRPKYYDGPVPEGYVLAPGELILTMTDLSRSSDTLGYPARIPSVENRRHLHNQRVGRVTILDSNQLDKAFAYYLFCTRDYRNEILSGATGTSIKHTSPSRIKAHKFLLPPLIEQRAIGRTLESLDKKIELNRRTSETLETTARALFKSWFIDFDPVRKKSEGRMPAGMNVETAKLFPRAFEDPEKRTLPLNWSTEPLDSTASFLNGLALQKYPAGSGPYLPVVKIAQMRAGITANSDRASASIPSQYIIEDGDVLFSWSGSLEVMLWTGGRGALNQHLFKVTSTRFSRWFYLFWLKHHLPQFRSIAADKATTMGHIQRHHLTGVKVIIPPAPLLHHLDKIMTPIINRLIAAEVQSRTLAELRDTLLPKLISGETRVKDAESLASAAL